MIAERGVHRRCDRFLFRRFSLHNSPLSTTGGIAAHGHARYGNNGISEASVPWASVCAEGACGFIFLFR
jgi:hypothetical protein